MGEMVRRIIGDSAGALADRGGGGGGGSGGWESEGPLPPGLASLVRSYAGEAALRRIDDDYAASQRYILVPQGLMVLCAAARVRRRFVQFIDDYAASLSARTC